MSPTQRTLKANKDLGRMCGIVERFNRFGGPHGIRQDLFGFIDIIAVDSDKGIVGIQSTGSAFSQHIHKMLEECQEPLARWLVEAEVELWGWRKVKLKRGGKAIRWKPRIADFYLKDGEIKYKERKPSAT